MILWLIGSAFVLLLAIAVFLFTSDLGRFKPQIEGIVSNALGRDFSINGPLSVDLSGSTIIKAADVRIANPAWAQQELFLVVENIEVTVDLKSVFQRPIIIDSIVSSGVNIRAEISEEHGPSWAMGKKAPEPAKPKKKGQAVVIKSLNIRDTEFTLKRPNTDHTHKLQLSSLSQERNSDNMLELDIEGRIDEYPISYEGTIGPIDNLIGGKDVAINGDGALGGMKFNAAAVLDHLARPEQPTIDLTVSGPSLENLANTLKIPAPGSGPFEIIASTRVQGDRLGVELHAELGENLVQLNGTSESISGLDNLEYDISASGPDLNAIMVFLGQDHYPTQPFRLEGAAHRSGPELEVMDMTLEIGVATFTLDGKLTRFPDLRDGNVELAIRGPEIERFNQLLGYKGVATGPFEMDLDLSSNDQGANVFDVNILNSLGRVQVTGSLGDGERYAGTEMEVAIEGHSAKTLLDGLNIPGFPDEPYQLSTHLSVQESGIEFIKGIIANVQDDRLEVEGFVSYDLLANTSIQYRLSGDDLSEFKPLTKASFDLPAEPYVLSGGLRTTPAGFRLDATEGTVGANSLSVDGLLSAKEGLSGSDLTFSISGPDLKSLLQPLASFDVPALGFSAQGHFRALSDQMRLEDMDVGVGDLAANGDVHINMPWTGDIALLSINASGPDITELLPDEKRWRAQPNKYELDIDARWAGETLEVKRARFDLGDASIDLNGSANLISKTSVSTLDFKLDVPTLSNLATLDNEALPDRPMTLSASLSGNASQFALNNILLNSGPNDLSGTFELDKRQEVPSINIKFTSNRFDWPYLGKDESEEASTRQNNDGRLIPDYELPLKQLGAINMEVDFSAARLNFKRGSIENLKLLGSLQDSVLEIQQLYAEGTDGNLDIKAAIRPGRGLTTATVALDLEASELALNLSKDADVNRRTLPQLNISLEAQGRGSTIREVAATLNGELQANSPGGVIPNSLLSTLDAGLFEQIFGTIIPGAKVVEDTQLECFASGFVIEDGLVESQPGAALVTNKVQLVARGSINLRNEELDLSFQTQPRKAYQANVSELLINPFVKISGTLAKPKPALDAGRAIIFSGAAAATGGVSILAKGLWDRMSKSADPCADFIKAGK